MSGALATPIREFRPGEFDWSIDRRLAPDHPFLQSGTWRAFAAGDPGKDVRVVASIDPRQRAGGGQVGAIGFIAVPGEPELPAVRAALQATIATAESWLAEQGCSIVRCPVQFSTWYGHRAMVDGFPQQGGPPPFPMEPANAPGLSAAITSAGFAVAHSAASYRLPVKAWIEGAQLGERLMHERGFRHRPIRLDRLDAELATIHAISMAAFRRSWGFSEVALDEFLAIYRALVPFIDPEFVRIAEAPDGDPVGFIFAFADPAAAPGRPDARFIAKSVAVLPDVRRVSPGVGTGLAVAVHRRAEAIGYPMAIHACVAANAYTQRISSRWGERFRAYATFEKEVR